MGNDVVIRVTGKNDSGPATTEAKKEIGELRKETEFFGKKAEEARTKVDALMKSLLELGQDGSKSVEQVTIEEKKLIAELEKAQAELSRFERHGKRAADKIKEALKQAAEEAAQAASQQGIHLGDMFSKGIMEALAAGGPVLIGAVVALGVMAMPTIGAMIGGAVLGGVGMGGMIGGIAAAAQDPRVKAAGAEFAKNALPDLQRLGVPFVEPVVAALDSLDDKVRGISMGPLLGAFEDLSREVAPFTLNLEKAADKFIPGFTRALKASEPVLRTLGNELPGLAADITAMFDAMSDDPDGAVMGMKKILDVTGDILVGFGEFIGLLEQTYETGVVMTEAVTGVLEKWFHWMSVVSPFFELLSGWMGTVNDDMNEQGDALERAYEPAKEFGDSLGGIAESAEEAAQQVLMLNKAIDDLLGQTLSWDQLQIRWHDGLQDLRDELASGAKTLSMFTDEGRKNRTAMDDLIGTAIRMRKEQADTAGVDAANAAFQKQIDVLYEQGRAAGFSKKELDALLGPYRDAPQIVALEFQFHGLLEGLNDIQRLARMRELLGDFSVDASTWSGQRNRERRGMASGGIASGGWTPMHEQGWEAVHLPTGATVIPHGASQAMMAGTASPQASNLTVQLVVDGHVLREVSINDALSRGVDPATVAGAYP